MYKAQIMHILRSFEKSCRDSKDDFDTISLSAQQCRIYVLFCCSKTNFESASLLELKEQTSVIVKHDRNASRGR